MAASQASSPIRLRLLSVTAAGVQACPGPKGTAAPGSSDGLSAEAVLSRAEAVLRAMVPSLPPTSGALVAQVQRILVAEPLQLLLAMHVPSDAGKDEQSANGTAVGALVIRRYVNTYNGRKAHIECMHVLAEQRSRGVGRALINAAKRAAASGFGAVAGTPAASPARELTFQVDSQNPGALRFFHREGMDLTDLAFSGPLALPSSSGAAAGPPAGFTTVEIVDAATRSIRPEYHAYLRAAQEVIRELRPNLPEDVEQFEAYVDGIVREAGRIVLAVQESPSGEQAAAAGAAAGAAGGAEQPAAASSPAPFVLGFCMHRLITDFSRGGMRKAWVDDLGTLSSVRSRGVGAALLANVRAQASRESSAGGHPIATFELDSGVHRLRAHAFYYREGMAIDAFSFGGAADKEKPEIAEVLA